MAEAAKALIVSAGDLGLAKEIDAGILRAARDGIVSSVSALVNGRQPRQLGPLGKLGVSMGVQVNLTLGRPLSRPKAVASLVGKAGNFRPTGRELAAKANPAEVEAEALAQVARARRLFKPVWMAAHEHFAIHPRLFAPLVAAAAQSGLWLRPLAAWQAEAIAAAGLSCPNRVEDAFYDEPGITVAGLLDTLDRLEPGVTEMLCLPGDLPQGMVGTHPYLWQRTIELSTLCNARIADRLLNPADPIGLIGYADLPPQP